MKTKFKKVKIILLLTFTLLPFLAMAQGDLEGQIQNWSNQLRTVAKAVVSMAAIGGGMYAYFKMQSDEGGNGKKALGSFVGALVFAALMFQIIDFFGV